MNLLPRVKTGIIDSVLGGGAHRNSGWVDNMLTQLEIDNPIIAEFLSRLRGKWGESATTAGLMVYKLLESQAEADELKELFEVSNDQDS